MVMEDGMAATEWRQLNQHAWAGPGGWTICKVFANGDWRYELWSPGEQGRIEGARATPEGAQALYDQLAQKRSDRPTGGMSAG